MKTHRIALNVLAIHKKLQEHYKKDYSFPSQKKVLELLKRWHGEIVSRATLCRCYKYLKDTRQMLSIQRTKRHPVHGLQHNSTLRIILITGYKALQRVGVQVGKWIQHGVEKYKHKYPEFAARSTKKMLAAVKANPQNGEQAQKIFNSLAENLSVNR